MRTIATRRTLARTRLLGTREIVRQSIPPSTNRSGHPIKHVFTRSIPSSQCMVCHMHPGTNMLTTYFGVTWWDNEIDGEKMYPAKQKNPSEEERYRAALKNPEAAAARGLWGDEKFFQQTGSPEFNKQLKTTQFADFHGHGWVYRGVYAHDRKGNWLDKENKKIDFDDPERFGKAVHLADIHLEKGMQCSDCHGTIAARANLITSGPAAPAGGRHLEILRTPSGLRRFEWRGETLM